MDVGLEGEDAYAEEARDLIDDLAEHGKLAPAEASRARTRLAEGQVRTALEFAVEQAGSRER